MERRKNQNSCSPPQLAWNLKVIVISNNIFGIISQMGYEGIVCIQSYSYLVQTEMYGVYPHKKTKRRKQMPKPILAKFDFVSRFANCKLQVAGNQLFIG